LSKEVFKQKLLKKGGIDSIVRQVKEMEQAEELEYEQEKQYLGDDDETNMGDLEQQLENLPNAVIKKKLENVLYAVMKETGKRRDIGSSKLLENSIDFQLELSDIKKIEEQLKEKPINNIDGTSSENDNQEEEKVEDLINKMDANQWKMVQERLVKDQDFNNSIINNKRREKESAFEEHKRLMIQRHEKMLRDKRKGQEESMYNAKKDLVNQNISWKKIYSTNKRKHEESVMFMPDNSRAPPDFNDKPEEGNDNDTAYKNEDPPYIKRRIREMFEEQESNIALKEFLIGLLGLLIANWFFLQVCLWSDKKQKGRWNL